MAQLAQAKSVYDDDEPDILRMLEALMRHDSVALALQLDARVHVHTLELLPEGDNARQTRWLDARVHGKLRASKPFSHLSYHSRQLSRFLPLQTRNRSQAKAQANRTNFFASSSRCCQLVN